MKRATSVACLTLFLALSSFAESARSHLSRTEAIRIAQKKISHDLGGRPWAHYQRTGASFLPEDRTWAVFYREAKSRSRCTVVVDDRTGQSFIMMP